jgi:hypothetical protein
MRNLFRNSAGGKAGAIDGLNLFFGALLGANLGTMQGMALSEYGQMIVLLAGTVMALRMISTSERRVTMMIVIGIYALLIAGMLFIPKLEPKGMAAGDFHRLVVTLAIWVVFVLLSELIPMQKSDDDASTIEAD